MATRRSPRRTTKRFNHEVTFGSIAEMADAYHGRPGVKDAGDHVTPNGIGGGWLEDWHGVGSLTELRTLANHGWQDVEADAMTIVESVLEGVERTYDLDVFTPFYDVAGGTVDIDRFLTGEPECMVNYLPVPTTDVGRVITLCASVCYSAGVSIRTIKRRGHTVAALALALTRIGLAVELWVDISCGPGAGQVHRCRVLVKGANDELDVAKIMFAYAHPAVLRGLFFGVANGYPEDIRTAVGIPNRYGSPVAPKRDLPEGTIYLPEVCSSHDVPDAYREVERTLRELGVLTDDNATV